MFSRRIKSAVDGTKARARKLADTAEWVFGRRAVHVLGAVVLLAVVVALLWLFLNWYVAPTKPSEKKDLVLALAQILAGAALLSGLYFTWRTVQVNREGQITDRFTRAIDQLGKTDEKGNKLLEIRLGGIYALERIARESEEDHWPIMEVLTAYVRQHAPLRPFEGPQGEEDAALEKSENDSGGSKRKSEPSDGHAPDPDIQAIMTVLRRSRSFDLGEPERLDLSETDLRGADLRGADLGGANLTEADLIRADLTEASLTEANLMEANLTRAILTGAILAEANFRESILTESILAEARFTGASFSVASLMEANLTRAILASADLRGADLRGADLRGADLGGASLRGAFLRKADLTVPSLTQAQLEDTTGDEHTLLPPDLNAPVHWGVKTDDQIEGD
jgi:uncharacterized protein YjbI with pentapeptide repeats